MLAALANGYALIDADDPTGNGQPAAQIVHLDAAGAVDGNSGAFLVKHADGGAKLVIANAGGPPSGDFFELSDAGQSITLPAASARVVTEAT